MLNSLVEALQDLFYPNLCQSCDQVLADREQVICTHCMGLLPETNYHELVDNPVTQRLYGRVPLARGTALYIFTKASKVQHLLHQIKYKNRPFAAELLGRYYGRLLHQSGFAAPIQLIIPVPLHPVRLQERGYNQSAYFAQGLSTTLKLPCASEGLIRSVYTSTQTTKNRLERLTEVREAFDVPYQPLLEGKHLLLVDDLITTGATLEACGQALLGAAPASLSVATLAIAS